MSKNITIYNIERGLLMNIALIIAGGSGARMKSQIPKQFITIDGKPIFIYTLEQFEKHSEIDYIQLVCREGWQKTIQDSITKFKITKVKDIVVGGATRYESIYNGMQSLDWLQDNDVIIVHDSVRPLVSDLSIAETIHVCKENGNSMSVVECTDSMYLKSQADYTGENVDRSNLVRGQTPEAVTYKRSREMYREAGEKGLQIDSISELQVALGKKVYFAKGSARNIKLTTIEDIALFKALLSIEKEV